MACDVSPVAMFLSDVVYLYHIVFTRHEVANFKLLFSQELGLVENYFVLRPPSVEHHVVKDSDCDDWDDCDGDGDIKTCRVPLQKGAEQGHPDDAGVRQDGDAGQEVDWTPGFRVRRSAGRTYGMAF